MLCSQHLPVLLPVLGVSTKTRLESSIYINITPIVYMIDRLGGRVDKCDVEGQQPEAQQQYHVEQVPSGCADSVLTLC